VQNRLPVRRPERVRNKTRKRQRKINRIRFESG